MGEGFWSVWSICCLHAVDCMEKEVCYHTIPTRVYVKRLEAGMDTLEELDILI